MELESFTILWIFLGVLAALIIFAIILACILCRKTKKSKGKDINHQRKLSAVIIDNFQNLEEFDWSYSRYTRAQLFQNEFDTPWAHVVQNGPVYDAGSSMNRPWIVGKRINPIYSGGGSNRSTLESNFRFVERKWKPVGGFYDFENGESQLDENAKQNMKGNYGYQNGSLQPGEFGGQQRYEHLPVHSVTENERRSNVSAYDIMEFRRDRTDSELTDPTEDPLLRVKMNKKRTSLVASEVERQKKSRTGDFYDKNQKKLKNYDERIQQTGAATQAVVFEY